MLNKHLMKLKVNEITETLKAVTATNSNKLFVQLRCCLWCDRCPKTNMDGMDEE